MKKAVAVLGATVMIQPPFSGIVTVTSIPSLKVFADNKAVYSGNLMVALSNVSGTGVMNGAGTGIISPTAIKTKADSKFVLRVDDENSAINVTGTISTTPFTSTSWTVDVKIVAAGQIKVLAE